MSGGDDTDLGIRRAVAVHDDQQPERLAEPEQDEPIFCGRKLGIIE